MNRINMVNVIGKFVLLVDSICYDFLMKFFILLGLFSGV